MKKFAIWPHTLFCATLVAILPNFACGLEGEPIHPEHIREVTQQVLSMRQFRYEKSALREWFEQTVFSRLEAAIEAVKSYLENIFNWFAARSGTNVESATLSRVAVVVAFFLLAGILLATILFLFKKAHRATHTARLREDSPRTSCMTSDHAIAAASAAAQRGDYLDAFRMVYLAVLLSLDNAKIIRFERSRTNWEYVRVLRAAGHQSLPVFEELTTAYDHRIYGGGNVSTQDYETSLVDYDQVVQTLETGVR